MGHSIELTCAGLLTHGESVALGMIVAAEIASAPGVLSAKAYDWHYRLLWFNGVDLQAHRRHYCRSRDADAAV